VTTVEAAELFGLYCDTLRRACTSVLSRNDEEAEHDLFEEFDIGAQSFFHDEALGRLQDAGLIDEALAMLSRSIREQWFALRESQLSFQEIRADANWHSMFSACDRAVERIERLHRDKSNRIKSDPENPHQE
jgi:hypothetical protein